MKTLQSEAGVQLQTMTSRKNSLPLEVRFCARQVLIRAQTELKVKRIQGEVPTYVFFSKLLPLPTDHFQLDSTKIPCTYFLFPSNRLSGQVIYEVACHE